MSPSTFPTIHVAPTDSLDASEEKLLAAFTGADLSLLAFDAINQGQDGGQSRRLYEATVGGVKHIVILHPAPWSEDEVLEVVNLLLLLKLDPDPPGTRYLFRFLGGEPVPSVLRALFGDSRASQIECSAAVVADFGNRVGPEHALQQAAAGLYLLREEAGVKTDFLDPEGPRKLAEAACALLGGGRLPPEYVPINILLLWGALYGEMLRSLIPFPARWLKLRGGPPWPSLAFSARLENGGPSPAAAQEAAEGPEVEPAGRPGPSTESTAHAGAASRSDAVEGVDSLDSLDGLDGAESRDNIVVQPTSTLLRVWQLGDPKGLLQFTGELEARCRESLGVGRKGPGVRKPAAGEPGGGAARGKVARGPGPGSERP